MKREKLVIKIVLYAILVFVAAITLLPIVYTIFSSFKENMEILNKGSHLLPEHFKWDNYSKAWRLADFATYTKNTVLMAGSATAGIVFFTTMSGYVYSRSNFKGKNILFGMIVATMFITTGSIGLYPQIQTAKFLHINRTIFGVSIIHMFSANAMNVYLIRNFVLGVPKELDEAAAIDGCNFFQTFIYIIMPLLTPVMATVGILSFVGTWNEYILPLIFTMGNPSQYPITVGLMALQAQGEAATAWNLLLAGTTIAMVPILMIFLIFNKYFAKGLTEGAVKG